MFPDATRTFGAFDVRMFRVIRMFDRVSSSLIGSSMVNRLPWPRLAFDPHPPAMRLDDVFHDAQADSNTLRLAPQLGTAPVKPLENFLVFLRRNARAVVGDGK